MKTGNYKNGISLIAVLMFMLAATTASVVIFRVINSENFSSGARLKQSEAYQASESGIDAVRGWLTNRAVDASALVTAYWENNPRRPIKIDLGGVGSVRGQEFDAYLMGVDTISKPMKLKILVEGRARDSSRVSQTAIFSVDGLYKINVPANDVNMESDFEYAFFGSFSGNTQGKFSSAVLNAVNNGDIQINGITTTGNLIATGNLSFQDNGDNRIGCHPTSNHPDSMGNLYVTGDFHPRGFTICGHAFVGGNMTTTSKPLFMRDLFVVGNITNSVNFAVMGNMTLGGRITGVNNDGMLVQGEMLLADVRGDVRWGSAKATSTHGNFNVTNDLFVNGGGGTFGGGAYQRNFANYTGLTVGRGFWTDINFEGSNNNANRMNFATQSGNVYVPNATFVSGNAWRNTNGNTNGVNFNSYSGTNVSNPTAQNKLAGATNLDSLAVQVEECRRPDGRVELCVPDPLELPQSTKSQWVAKADTLTAMANEGNFNNGTYTNNRLISISPACVRLLRERNGTDGNIHNQARWYGGGGGAQAAFVNNVNQCYADLKDYKNGELLYSNGGEQFLAVNLKATEGHTERDQFDGKFIFVFKENVTNMKLGETTKDAVVFIYLMEGATGTMALTGGRNDGKHRNYFIYSEKDIAGASGSTTLNGTIFLANGAKSGPIVDTDINFNKDLFNSLLSAGILGSTKEVKPPGPECDPSIDPNCIKPVYGIPDIHWIPIASRLLVKLENKEITKERAPQAATAKLESSILVMPRVVRLTTNQLSPSNSLRRFYTYMYLAGAELKDTATNAPVCDKGFKPSGNNAADVYTCRFQGNLPVPHSDFYVKVSGESGKSKVWLEADGGKTTVAVDDKNPCANVYVVTELNEEYASRTAYLELLHSASPGQPSGWKGLLEPSKSVTLQVGEVSKLAYQFCIDTTSQTSSPVVVKLLTADGADVVSPDEITITRIMPILDIERIPCSTLCNEMVICPNSGTEWLNLACGTGSTIRIGGGWQCDVVSGQTAEASVVPPIPEACEAPPNITDLNRNLGLKVSSALQGDKKVSFEFDLAWKKQIVTVTGRDEQVTLRTTNANVPANQREFVCAGSCEVYHGAVYSVTHPGGQVSWSCSPNASCGGENYLKTTGGSEVLSATSAVNINLDNLIIGLVSCELESGLQVIKGTTLPTDLSQYVKDNYDLRGPCGTPTFTYSASPNNTNGAVGSTISISMGVTCSENATTSGNANVQCSGNIVVVDEIAPSITCEWGNGTADYYVGSTPSLKVSVTNGNVTTCARPTISASTFSGIGIGNWNVPVGTAASSTPGVSVNYAINATSNISATDTNRSVTVQTVCINGAQAGTKTATCSGKNIGDQQPCEAITAPNNFNDICPGATFPNDVLWNTAPTDYQQGSRCYYVTGISGTWNGTNWKINGKDYNGYHGTISGLPEKIDNGYYIYMGRMYSSTVATGTKPDCVPPPEPTLSCTWAPGNTTRFVNASNVIQSGGVVPTPTATCSNGADVSTSVSWRQSSGGATYSSTPWSGNVSPGTYNVWAYVASGCGTLSKEIRCGNTSLTVKSVPSINQCTGTANQNVTLPTIPTQPTVTLDDPSNVCSNNGSNTPNADWTNVNWTASRSGTNVSPGTWSSLFTMAGTYNNYSVSGKCGDYPTNLTANCGGSATVTGAATCAYNPSWCNNIAFAQVVKTNQNGDQNGPRCVFATTISNMGNENGALLVNGIKLRGSGNSDVGGRCGNTGWGQRTCSDALANDNVQKADGGYYIYIPNWAGDFNTTGGEPACGGGGTTPSSSSAAASSSSASGGGGTSVNITTTDNNSGPTLTAGDYTVNAIGTCTNVRFNCNWNNQSVGCSIQVTGSTTVSGGHNSTNNIMSPKPVVGTTFKVVGTVDKIWCAGW